VTRLRAVVFDWAGTTVDHGSLAPVRTLQRVFEEFSVLVSEKEVRHDMGVAKRAHIAAILKTSRVSTEWRRLRGNMPAEADIDELYNRFIPLQFSCLAEYSSVISEVPGAVEAVRKRGLKIGATTGYTREMLDLLVEKAAAENYSPDCSLAPEDVGAGRPLPFMLYEIAVRLRVWPLSSVVKVGDTVADIKEGLNAGTWTVGVTRTGNTVGLGLPEWNALDPADQQSRLADARRTLEAAGAHFVIENLSELDQILNRIETRMQTE
jgi:phosphonoacetaldehyde hydrolase